MTSQTDERRRLIAVLKAPSDQVDGAFKMPNRHGKETDMLKPVITLYHDLIDDRYMTEDLFGDHYDEMQFTATECGEDFPFTSCEQYAEHLVSIGQLETVNAYLQSGDEIFPCYYSTEVDDVFTALDMYRLYLESETHDTFGAFMDVSVYDTFNPHYGFYK